jgi:cell division protein FtsQ
MQQIDQTRPSRKDPAPSRWAFRIERLWLTPLFRQLVRVGLPVFSVVFLVGLFFSDETNRQTIAEHMADIRRSVAERPEFMVKLMAVDGASNALAETIRTATAVDLPKSSFDLDLDQMKVVIEQIEAVARAELRIRPGGILQVQVTERVPAILWREGDTLALLDKTGKRVAVLGTRSDRADLPLIVGEGADIVVPQALRIIAAAAPIEDRLRGLVRMGERRWDLVLDRDQRILLPENAPVDALEQIIAQDQAQDLFSRDLVAIDMRNATRPTLRMAPPAVEELRRIKALERGDLFQ